MIKKQQKILKLKLPLMPVLCSIIKRQGVKVFFVVKRMLLLLLTNRKTRSRLNVSTNTLSFGRRRLLGKIHTQKVRHSSEREVKTKTRTTDGCNIETATAAEA